MLRELYLFNDNSFFIIQLNGHRGIYVMNVLIRFRRIEVRLLFMRELDLTNRKSVEYTSCDVAMGYCINGRTEKLADMLKNENKSDNCMILHGIHIL